jgi:hypothetical protein
MPKFSKIQSNCKHPFFRDRNGFLGMVKGIIGDLAIPKQSN